MSDSKGKGGSYNSKGISQSMENPLDSFLSKYKLIEKIGEGSYSEVLKCKHRENGNYVACKRLKHVYRNWHQVNDIAEITTLRALPKHINILQMVEIHFDQGLGKVSLVFEIMDMNLYELIKDRKRMLGDARVRLLMFQLMKGIRHLHKNGIFHRDIKPENILLREKNDLLKLGDLGSVRGLYSRPPYTEYISTRWYRSPECLLTAGYYSFKMDIWAAACVFYEILTLRPLFPGASEIDQVNRIHNLMGPPPQRVLHKFFKQSEVEKDSYRNRSQQARWEGIQKILGGLSSTSKNKYSEGKSKNFDWQFNGTGETGGLDKVLPHIITNEAKDLLKVMLSYDPDARPTAHRVLVHQYFHDVSEIHKDKEAKSLGIVLSADEKGKQSMSSSYEHVDLKTLGDKKFTLQMRRERDQRYIQIQKKTEAKVKALAQAQLQIKKSSPLLEGADSPATPDSNLKQKDFNFNVYNVMQKSEMLMRRSQAIKDYEEEQTKKKLSIIAKNNITDKTVSVNESTEEETPAKAEDKGKTKDLPINKPSNVPDTLTGRKRQVFAGNLPPSVLQNKDLKLEIKDSQKIRSDNRASLPTLDRNNNNNSILMTSNKVLNHKLTTADLKKINENRQLVHLEPIKKSESQTIKKSIPQNKVVSESPYTKTPAELSLAGRRKLLLQKFKLGGSIDSQSQIKKIERFSTDSSTMNVPPQIAAAALKYTSLTRGDTSKKNGFNGNSINSSVSENIGKVRFGQSRVTTNPEDMSPQNKLKILMNELEKAGSVPISNRTRTKEENVSSYVPKRKVPAVTVSSSKSRLKPSIDMNLLNGNVTNMEVFKTLELDKQKRLSLRVKDDNENLKQNVQEPAANQIFPRNRFGAGKTEEVSKLSQIQPKKVSDQRKFWENDLTALAPTNLGLSAALGKDDKAFKKPPLPPTKRIQLQDKDSLTKRDVLIGSNKDSKEDQAIQVTESMKRRAARIKAQLREDVYCSSDDDIMSTMRQKFDELISQRVNMYYDDSNENVEASKDEDTISERARRLQKYLRRGSSFVSQESDLHGANNKLLARHKPSLNIGDSNKAPSYQQSTSISSNKKRAERSLESQLPPKQHATMLPLSPNSLLRSRLFQGQQRGQMYNPPGNKPTYYSAHQGVVMMERDRNFPIVPNLSLNRSSADPGKRIEALKKQPRRRMHHIS